MHEAIFRIDYDSLYSQLTLTYDVKMKLWCNNRWDAIYISGSEYKKAIDTITDEIGVYDFLAKDEEVTVFTEDCLLQRDNKFIEKYLEYHNCLLLPPFSYENGAVLLQLIAQELEQLTRLHHDLQQEHALTVEMKRTVDFTSFKPPLIMTEIPALRLSKRQEEALVTAYESGYYEIPRDVTTQELAEQLEVNRRTFEDHLRRGENKLMQAFNEQHEIPVRQRG
jgi:predicted DNA binding protein